MWLAIQYNRVCRLDRPTPPLGPFFICAFIVNLQVKVIDVISTTWCL